MKITRADLFSNHGFPIQGLRCALDIFDCKTLEELQARVGAGEISVNEIYRIRGNGHAHQPGRLPRFLFGVPDRIEQLRLRAIINQGDGI